MLKRLLLVSSDSLLLCVQIWTHMKKFRDLHIRSTPHALQGSLAAYAAKLWNGIWFRFKRWGVAHSVQSHHCPAR
jgi:hypothetical protein